MPDELRLPGSDAQPPAHTLPADRPGAYDPGPSSAGQAGHAGGPTLPADSPTPSKNETTPPRSPAAAPPPEASAKESLVDRIAHTTAAGGFGGRLPEGWGDQGGDWQTVRSDDPFEVLFLDYRQADRIAPALVAAQSDVLRKFWDDRNDLMNMGANRTRIAGQFGGEEQVRRAPKLVERAFRLLADEDGIRRQAEARHRLRCEAGERELAKMARGYLADGALEVDETRSLLEDGLGVGLTYDEGAVWLERELATRGFQPAVSPIGRSPAERMASVRWLTAARAEYERRHADETDELRRAAAEARRLQAAQALHFGDRTVSTVEELIDACDEKPDQAAGYLYAEYIEQWLSRTLGRADLALAGREARAAWPTKRRHGLEQFVRALCARAQRPATPIVKPDVPTCAFGAQPVGATRALRVRLLRDGRPYSWGRIQADASLRGVSVPQAFIASDAWIDVALDTFGVPPGRYAGIISLSPDGGPLEVINVEYEVVPLKLHAEPAVLDLGAIPFRKATRGTVRVASSPPGGRLTGGVGLVEPIPPGVTLTGQVAGDAAQAEVTIDTSGLVAGRAYRTLVRAETSAGVVDVPVRFRVRLALLPVVAWMVAMGGLTGVLMALARSALGERIGAPDWYLKLPYGPRAFSLIFGTLVVLVVWNALARVLRPLGARRPQSGAPTGTP